MKTAGEVCKEKMTEWLTYYDGFDIVGEVGDLIQQHGQSTQVRIIDIDYVNNILTLNQTLSWTEGQGVHLAYSGIAPDIGSYEYEPEELLAAPVYLRIIVFIQ